MLGIKMFYKDTPLEEQKITIDPSLELQNAFSVGVIFNSEGKEVVSINFIDESSLSFQWDGKKLIPFEKEIPASFLKHSRNLQYIAAAHVNIRSTPSIKGEVLSSAQFLDEVEIVKVHVQQDTIQGVIGYWHHIKYNEEEGYVWSHLVIPNVVKSLKTKGLAFMGKEGRILAIKDRKVIDSVEGYADDLVPLGTLGVSGVSELIATCHRAESCGQTSGDIMYSWDGQKIKKFVDNTGVGDGGFFEGNEVVFPSFYTGTKNRIRVIRTEGESVNVPSTDLLTSSYDSFYNTYIEKIYEVTDQKLIEKSTETQKIEKFINQEFNARLAYFKLLDFNKDGYQDAIVSAKSLKDDSMVVVLQGSASGEYKVHSYSNKLIR